MIMNKEYTFLGLNMEKISILYGAFLIVWGLWVTSVTGSDSMTSFIPSILGIPVITLSLLAIVLPKRKRLLMHIVVIFGLIILLGGLDFIRNIAIKTCLTLATLIVYLIPVNIKADTINETSRYAFASLIDELTECSIFYSIMGAGEDNTGNLSENSKRFLKLSEQLTLMTLSLAERIDLKRETIMSKAERFSKEMGEQIGYDGINISILTNKHGDFCRNLTENPEERLIFWIGKESK